MVFGNSNQAWKISELLKRDGLLLRLLWRRWLTAGLRQHHPRRGLRTGGHAQTLRKQLLELQR